MDCCPSRDEGYATAAAMVFCLALSMVVTAGVVRSVSALAEAKADLSRTQAEIALDGAQLQAAAEIVRSGRPGPYRWSFGSDIGWANVEAEPEAAKISPAAAAGLDDAVFRRLGVQDVAALKMRLAAVRSDDPSVDVAGLDAAPLWQTCAPGQVSGYGEAAAPATQVWSVPGPGPKPAVWHIGEAWRVAITTTTGWRDDRIVRFTGDAMHPAATIVRWMGRGEGDGAQCDSVWLG